MCETICRYRHFLKYCKVLCNNFITNSPLSTKLAVNKAGQLKANLMTLTEVMVISYRYATHNKKTYELSDHCNMQLH